MLDADRVREEVAAYRALAFSKVDPADVAGLSDDAAYALMKQAYGEDEFRMLYDPYYVYLFSPWKAGALEPYQVAAQLDDGAATGSTKPSRASYSARSTTAWAVRGRIPMPSARYWTEKQDGVGEPLAYGTRRMERRAGMPRVLRLRMVAVCIALTPVFSGEYQDRTDACCSRRATAARSWWRRRSSPRSPSPRPTSRWRRSSSWASRSRSSAPRAGTCRCRCCRCPSVRPHDGRGDLDGGGDSLPHDAGVGGSHAAVVVEAALQLAIFAACAALIFLTGMIPSGGNAVLLHALYLFPNNGLNDQVLFNSLVSYPVGSFVIDLIGLLACVYALVLAACVPLAARAFRRHQVV